MDKNYFSKNLKALRENKGLSLEELSMKLSLTEELLSKWENNEVEPNIIEIDLICDYFNVEIDDILNEPFDIRKKISISKIVEDLEVKTQHKPNLILFVLAWLFSFYLIKQGLLYKQIFLLTLLFSLSIIIISVIEGFKYTFICEFEGSVIIIVTKINSISLIIDGEPSYTRKKSFLSVNNHIEYGFKQYTLNIHLRDKGVYTRCFIKAEELLNNN